MKKHWCVWGVVFFLFSAANALFAAGVEDDPQALMAKIERAESNQKEIFKQLAEIKQELSVLKIRAGHRIVKKP